MATRKSTKTIDPISLCSAALKAVKAAADYHRLGNTTKPAILEAAWKQLSELEQQRITEIVNANTTPTPEVIAQELSACGTYLQLKGIKTEHGEALIKKAWQLLPESERDRIKALCREPQSEPASELECNGACIQDHSKEWSQEQAGLQPEPKPKKTLIELTADLQQLDDLLDAIDGDIPVDLQQAVDALLAQREQTHEALLDKLDNYCGLIKTRLLWASARKAEAERMMKLAESDFKTVDFLKGRLKAHLEATDQKQFRTRRFNITLRTAGGKPAMSLSVKHPEELPERFQRIVVEPDNQALRQALEAEDPEASQVAYFAQRSAYIAIN